MIFKNVSFGTEFDKTKLPKCWSEKRKCDYESLKDRFDTDVKKVLKELVQNSDKLFSKTPNDSSQYSQCVFWYKLAFSDEALTKLKQGYENVRGIHIMPYTITEEDIKSPFKKGSKKFCCAENDYIDFDAGTGNFHKYVCPEDVRYQVVLIPKKQNTEEMAGGPGRKKGRLRWKDNKLVNANDIVKKDWYSPEIQSEKVLPKISKGTSAEDFLIDYLNKAFETIFENAYYNKIKLEKSVKKEKAD